MKVFIKTEGGENIGLGHLTRCISLYQAFLEKGIRPEFIINDSFQAQNFLKKNKIKFLIDKDSTTINFDILIVDSYITPKDCYDELAKNTKLLVSIDDFNRLDYPSGLVINSSIYTEKIKYKKNRNLRFLLGTKYAPLRKDFWEIDSKEINKEIKKILLTFGGFNDNFAKRMTKFLLNNFDYYLTVILGQKDSFIEDSKCASYYQISGREMRDLMLDSDICISGGGQTTYELAKCGVPTISICFADNQVLNVKSWAESEFLEFAGWNDEKNLFRKIKESLKTLSYEKRTKMSQIGQRCVDGQGARRVVGEILSYAEN